MNKLLAWFDDRTGYKKLLHEALYENIPGGARWRYVWGSTLVFTFSVQVITGIFLWMCYSPSSRSAWESVYYIQYEMSGGFLLRGIHHFTAQAMIVLLALHLVQVVIDGAYKAPREVNFWLGLILMQIVLGLSLTGYLLPWDQKGYWATNVATNLMALVPFVGADLQKLVVGGPTYGHATLTRFFALHAGVLPGALIAMLGLHMAVFRRHGICAVGADKKPAVTFWPDQVLKDAIACLVVMAVILLFVVKGAITADHAAGEPPQSYLGAELGAPADASTPYSAARPEWYFLFLFQFLKYFHGESEIYGAIIIPGIVMTSLFLMPFLGRWKLGHVFNVVWLTTLGIGIVFLTYTAIQSDRGDDSYGEAVELAEINRIRAIQLAKAPQGIPDGGAVSLLRSDPKTQGPILFTRHCASCHAHTPPNGDSHNGSHVEAAQNETGGEVHEALEAEAKKIARNENRHFIPSRNPSAPDLYKYATREWMGGLLDPEHVDGPRFFGPTSHSEGEMAGYVKGYLSDESEWSREQIDQVLLALAVEARLELIDPEDETQKVQIEVGRALIKDTDRCAQCHKFHEVDEGDGAPDLTDYASRQWMIDFISNPTHERFYGDSNDRMPAYAKDPNDPRNNVLTPRELELMVDWLRGQWYEPATESEDSAE